MGTEDAQLWGVCKPEWHISVPLKKTVWLVKICLRGDSGKMQVRKYLCLSFFQNVENEGKVLAIVSCTKNLSVLSGCERYQFGFLA